MTSFFLKDKIFISALPPYIFFFFLPPLCSCLHWCMWARPGAGQEVVIPKSDKMGSVPTQWTQTHSCVYWDYRSHTQTHTSDMIYILPPAQSIMGILLCSDIYCSSALSLSLRRPHGTIAPECDTHTLTHRHTQRHEVILNRVSVVIPKLEQLKTDSSLQLWSH